MGCGVRWVPDHLAGTLICLCGECWIHEHQEWGDKKALSLLAQTTEFTYVVSAGSMSPGGEGIPWVLDPLAQGLGSACSVGAEPVSLRDRRPDLPCVSWSRS